MKSLIHHALEGNENAAMSRRNLDAISRFVERYAKPEEIGADIPARRRDVHPGIKALGRIKGNLFTDGDVQVLVAFVGELAGRAEAACDALVEEGSGLGDTMSSKAYAHLVSSIRAGADDALRIVAEWSLAFREALGEGPMRDQPASSLAALPS